MESDVVVPFRRIKKSAKKVSSKRVASLIDCWDRLHEVIETIPDENLRAEALEFWQLRVPRVLHGSQL